MTNSMTAAPERGDSLLETRGSAPSPADEPARLAAVRATGLLDSPSEQAFDDLSALAATLCGTPISLVTLIDAQRVWFKAAVGLPQGGALPRAVAFCAHTICGRPPLIVNDLRLDARFRDNPLVIDGPRVRFYAGAPLFNEDGRALGTLCVLDHEPRSLSARQRDALEVLARQAIHLVELQLAKRDALQALAEHRQAQADLEDFFTEAPALLGITDRRGNIVRLNPTWTETLGYDRETLSAEPLLSKVHPEDVAEAREKLIAMDRGEPVEEFLCRYRTSTGAYRTLSWFAKVSHDQRRVHAIAQDITERRETERLRSELVATVSHELRTPLTSIHGALELLANQVMGPLTPEALELVQIAGRNTQQLRQLVNELLELERLESDQWALQLAPARLDQLVAEACQTLATLGLDHGVTLRSEAPALSVLCDGPRLSQVLLNLGSNAIRHSPSGAVVRFRATLLDAPPRARLEVIDQGPGVPEHERERIFERFVQGRAITSEGGSGLGLAICKAIVEAQGGEIGVEDAEESGARFWVELPAPDHPPPGDTSALSHTV